MRPPSVPTSIAAVVTIASMALVTGCTFGATVVEVVTSTDAPGDRSMILTAEVRREGGPTLRRVLLHADPIAGRLPASFGVVPSDADRDAPITVRLEANFPPTGSQPSRTISRVAEFNFVRGEHARLPLFLSWRCGNETTGCRTGGTAACTVSRRCEERGLTCDESGECVSAEAMPIAVPDGADASFAGIFDARRDTSADARVDGSMDTAVDVRDSGTDAAMDAAVDVITVDTRVCSPGGRRCDGSRLHVCNAEGTAESFVTTCGSAPLCTSGTGAACAPPACSAGQTRCNGAAVETCNSDLTGWSGYACDAGAVCGAYGCVTPGSCTPGNSFCSTCPVNTANDCLSTCVPDGSGWSRRDCGWGQPPSCDPVDATHGQCV